MRSTLSDIFSCASSRYFLNASSPSVTFSNICWCAKSFNCSSAMGLYPEFDGRMIYWFDAKLFPDHSTYQVPGLRFACLPFSALEQGTLECLFDTHCVRLVWSVKLDGSPPQPLTTNSTTLRSRFLPNSTIGSMVDQLFLETWKSQNVSYIDFFRQCQPILCTYSSVSRGNIVLVMTTLIALLGGLSMILKLLAPFLVRLGLTIFRKRSTSTALPTVASVNQGITLVEVVVADKENFPCPENGPQQSKGVWKISENINFAVK